MYVYTTRVSPTGSQLFNEVDGMDNGIKITLNVEPSYGGILCMEAIMSL